MRFKRLIILTPLLSSLFLLCNCNKLPSKVNTLFGVLGATSMIPISKTQLDTFMDKDVKKTFIFVQTTATCSCSFEFEKIVNDYIKDTGLEIYCSDYSNIKDTNYGFALREDKPTFHVILKGQNLGNLEKYDDASFRSDANTFKSFMDKHISKPSIFKVNINQLRSLYDEDTPFAVYFGQSNCVDCKYFENFILTEYAQSHLESMKKMYYFDTSSTNETINDEFGLSYASNNNWGYLTGGVPIIQYVNPKDHNHSKNNSIEQAFMFGNDILDETYKIKESYYKQERINKLAYGEIETPIGQQYSANQTKTSGNYIMLKNEYSDELYRSLTYKFFDYLERTLN